MPDDPLLRSCPTRAANRDTFFRDSDETATVSTNIERAAGACLAAPPRDVGRMLERYGTVLPCYLDAQRLRDIQSSQQRWPILRAASAANEGANS